MKQCKNILSLIIICSLCLFHSNALAGEPTTGVNVIYLLDVSGSMKKGGLFENIKMRLTQLVDERSIGDRVTLITFAADISKIIDIEIRSRQDVEDIKKVIDNLKAEGPWTWMSSAFQRTKDIAEDIKSKSPEKKIMIYLLTDCDNDPPPAVKKKEPPWKFVEVLTNYFKDFKTENTNIYLLSYRPLEQDEKDKIKKETAIIVREPEASEPIPKIPEPRHEPESGTDLWKWLLFVIALVGTIILIAWTMRQQKTKTLWIKTENGEVYEAFLRGRQKLWLDKHPTGEYLELGLPTYFLTLGKIASVMLCEDKSGEKRRVDFTKAMQCELDKDKTVSLRFYEAGPVKETESKKEEDKTQHPTGPMDEI